MAAFYTRMTGPLAVSSRVVVNFRLGVGFDQPGNGMIALSIGLLAAFTWSVHDLIARRYALAIGPYRMTVMTMMAGFVMLLVPIWQSPGFATAGTHEWLLMLLLGIVYAIAVSSLFMGFAMAPVSVVAPFTAGYPALIVAWGIVHGLEPSVSQYLAMGSILAGAVIVGRYGHDDGGVNTVESGKLPIVIFFSVLACVCFAADALLGQYLSKTFGEVPAAGMLRLPAALCLLPIALREKTTPGVFTRWAIMGIFAMAIMDATALAAINYVGRFPNKEVGAMGISTYGGMATLLAMFVLKEKVSPMQWAGIGAIVAGVAVLGISAG